MTDERSRDQLPDAWSGSADGYRLAFEPFTGLYVEELLDRAGVGPGTELLDVAAGTGAVSVAASERGATVLATDFAAGMVEHLAARLAALGHEAATTAVMDGQALDVDDDRFDVAVSSFGVIFFPDLDAGLRELRRAVRPGGRVGVTTWNVEGFRLVGLVGEAMVRGIEGFAVPPSEPVWARVGTADGLRQRLVDAGLVDVEVTLTERTWSIDDPAAFFRSLPDWSPPVQPLFELLTEAQIGAAADAFVEVLAEQDAAGGLRPEVLVGVGVAPG